MDIMDNRISFNYWFDYIVQNGECTNGECTKDEVSVFTWTFCTENYIYHAFYSFDEEEKTIYSEETEHSANPLTNPFHRIENKDFDPKSDEYKWVKELFSHKIIFIKD